MRTRWMRALAASWLVFFCVVAAAQVQPPEIAARNYLLMDVSANQVLAAKDIDSSVDPASLTKLMASYLVFQALQAKKIDLKQTLPVSEQASRMPGSRMFIESKMQVPVDDLLKGMIVQSGNDATMALAEGVGGTADHFVEMMNAQAKALGMNHTAFRNAAGLPQPGQVTTVRDLGILATRLMQDFPQQMPYFAIRKYRYAGTPVANDTNRNTLLFRDPTVDGLNSGHTETAGYCLVATAKRDFPNLQGRRLLAIVLGASSDFARSNETQKLLNWGYTAFEGLKLFDGGQPVVQPPVWKGSEATVKLGQPRPVVLAVPAGSSARIRTQVARPDPLVAPIAKGQQVGTLKISVGDQPLREVPLVALEAVDTAGLFGRAWDAIRLWIK
ncbi:D-alanyl-D-alanine carboxypeptidase [Ramlibacter ginsenosidimutans]|uniref:serine-type D-Ala-D-Ala carboxypeptidase n=2 Tax=Ramlibacter ginsenosidimutans TaxID=502333 RepID=A0A934TRP4_9BURK|nr:D-alanyl-D-alanine carboxypeptidase family protein [Ramlibacter ginsenosidimutans]MBK6006013.1 D-alanyl-D-alanine carboxypeptidase [Ramlibacter ginsenosidimutans]